MRCKYCDTVNEEDALFCKKCGSSLVEEEKKNKDKVKVKNRTKTKTKHKNKVKKEKEVKTKVIREKSEKNSTGKSIIIFFLVLIILALCAVSAYFGYDYYQKNYNINVPDFVGMTYDDARVVAAKESLKLEKVEVVSEDENIDKIVKQNRRVNSKVKKNTIIKVSVGIEDTSYKVPKFIGQDIDDVISTLENAGIKYNIEYNEDECTNNEVLKQDPLNGKKINPKYDNVTLLVCKEVKSSSVVEEEKTTDKTDDTKTTKETED